MLQRRPGDWIAENRLLAGAIALSLVAALVGVAAVVRDDDSGNGVASSIGRGGTSTTGDDGETLELTPGPDDEGDAGGAAAGQRATARTGRGGRDGTTSGAGGGVIPGTQPGQPCRPRSVDETGVTDDEITIGQIVTDVNQLPQQLRPAHEGLKAYIDAVNEAGGVCGRRIRIEYRNDNMNPATHRSDYESLSRRVFAFVANESLLESQDYRQEPPFEPNYTDGGRPVPDVGGLAFSYGRSQSEWHAGIVGSISPVLVGGGQYKYYAEQARSRGAACRTGGVVYLNEPTGASRDQAELGRVAVEEEWGAGVGRGNTRMYAANLADPVPVYEVMVDNMIADGVNCVFAYIDLGSSVNLVRAMANRGVWPPASCRRGPQCFRVAYVTLAAHDPKFLQDAGPAARDVVTFIPHLPLNESGHPAMRAYLEALGKVADARPSTFSIFGFASGQMFVEALQSCGAAPTRNCVMSHLRSLRDFDSGGLLGRITPFRRTKVTFGSYGTYDWKHIFNCSVALRVGERGGRLEFQRARPADGFFCDSTKVARGTPG